MKAVNHLGWEVQAFDSKLPEKGWYPAIEEHAGYTDDDEAILKPLDPFTDKADADDMLEWHLTDPNMRKDLEYRIYEVVSEKVK